ncbi:helix-turn-helix domain-containing protein [Thermus thalpophilus]|uniref:helix-turn-helix domain-containing protein n=1 Tax=Thermus thalpophilus TaxID=2908147 RepID=UPI001FAA43CE|nr:helix-turn-helix domain-containing protein [Thermus thalpophilus]
MSKSEQIRQLFQEGKDVSEIAKVLGISYQHVYNVLRRSGLLKPKKIPATPQAYEAFIAGLELQGVALQALSAELKRMPEGKKGANLEVKPFGPEPLDGGFRAGLTLTAQLLEDGDLFGHLEVKVAASYRSSVFPEGDLFQMFAEHNLPLNLWPYLRFYVDFLTTQMGLPPLTLPLFKV